MATSKRRDFLKWGALSVSALPTLPLLQSLTQSQTTATGTQTPITPQAPQMKLALSRISPYYLSETANAMASGLGRISGSSWETAPQVQDNLLENLANGSLQAALISPSFYSNFPKKAALFGSIPHPHSDAAFDAWLKSQSANELREEIYSQYGVKAITLGAFTEASGFYSRFEDPMQGFVATHRGLENAENSLVMDPFEGLAHFEAGRIDRSHTLAHRQHVNLGLPNKKFFYHETRGLRSAASFELLINNQLWESFGSKGQYELQHLVSRVTDDLRGRLSKLNHHYAMRIRNMANVHFIKAPAALEESFRAERERLFANLVSGDSELQAWQDRIG